MAEQTITAARDGSGWRTWLVALGLLLAVGIAFGNALQNQFVFDDYLLIINNPSARAPLTDLSSLNVYRPARALSYRIDYAIGGLHPWIFHLSNIVYHAITVLLVCALLRACAFSLPAAAAGALLFAIHPVQTDAVTYASGRRDVLCGLFFAAGFLAYLSYRARRSTAALVAAVACYAGAILSKEMGVTLPLVCLLYDRWEARHAGGAGRRGTDAGAGGPRRVRLLVWVGAALLVGLAVYALSYGPFLRNYLHRVRWHGGSAGANYATVARIWVHYLGLVIWPAQLTADYSFRTFPVSTSLLDARAIIGAAVLLVLAALAVRSWRRGGTFGFAAGWWAITLLPVSHVLPYSELMAEHYLYIPMMGVAFAFAGAVAAALAWVPERRRAIAAAVLLIAAAATVRTIVRNRDWRDTLSIWSATVATAPDCARARFNLGQAYFERVRFADAEREWLAAAALRPRDPATARALATLYYRLGKYDLATARVKDAMEIAPYDAQAEVLAGWIAVDSGEPERALPYFDSALARLPPQEAAGAKLGRDRAMEALHPPEQTMQRLKKKSGGGEH